MAGMLDTHDAQALRQDVGSMFRGVVQPDVYTIDDGGISEPQLFNLYPYRALTTDTEIRLLRIPGRDNIERIKAYEVELPVCDIVHIEPGKKDLEYEALSYAWGKIADSPSERAPVFIRNHQEITFMFVTLNLFSAIHRLRFDAKDRYLWIDQLCINQYDLVEKAQQILLMPDIYQKAASTVVWLGDEDAEICRIYDWLFDGISVAGSNSTEAVQNMIQTPEAGVWNVGSLFFAKAWFTRQWVFQEVVLSSSITIHCGRAQWNFEDVVKVRDFYGANGLAPRSRTRGFQTLHIMRCFRLMYHNHRSKISLLHLLYDISATFDCRDPRDKVFALLSVVPPDNQISRIVDYTVTTEAAFTNTTNYLVSSTASLHHLACIHYTPIVRNENGSASLSYAHGDAITLNLPSWVPDLTRTQAPLGIEMPTNIKFRASCDRQHQYQPLPNKSLLVVKGKQTDVVKAVVDYAFEDFTSGPLQERIPLSALASCLLSQYPEVERTKTTVVVELLRAITKTAMADGVLRVETPKRPTTLAELDVMIHAIVENMDQSVQRPDCEGSDVQERLRELCEQISPLFEVCRNRRLAVLQNHPVALIPKTAQPGDCVYILHGSSVPILLRSTGPTSDRYVVLGQCYVEEMMYGEVVSWEEVEADTFILE